MAEKRKYNYHKYTGRNRKGVAGSIKLIDRKTFEEGYKLWSTGKIPLYKFAEMCEVDRNTLRYKLAFFYRMGYLPAEWFYDKDDPSSIEALDYDISDIPKPYKKWTPENGYEN